jgi:hypothetical protein
MVVVLYLNGEVVLTIHDGFIGKKLESKVEGEREERVMFSFFFFSFFLFFWGGGGIFFFPF